MATQIGPKIGIEGEQEYKNALKQIVNETKNLDAAMQKTASEFTANTSAMTRSRAEAQTLTAKTELQAQKVELLGQMLEKCAAKYGENATATQSWQRQLDYATASLNKMQSQLGQLHGAEAFSDISTQVADFGQKMQNMGQSLMSIGGKMTAAITLPLAAAGAAAINLGSDFEESANKVDVVFGSMAGSVRDFAQTTTNAFAISEGKALQMAGDYGAMATSMGLTESEAARLSTSMVGLAGDMASFHNKSTDIAANSLKGVFTGETESLKQFGVAMTQTNLEEFAAKQGKVYDKMSQGEKIMTRYQYLLDTQADAMGDASRTMDGFAGSSRQMQASLEDAGAALGQALVPMITPIIQAITKLAQAFANLPAPVQKMIAVFGAIVAVIGPVILIIGALMSSFGAILTNAPLIAGAFAAIGASISASMGPFLLVASIIGIVAVAIYGLVQNWDDITAAASNAASALESAGQAIAQMASTMYSSVSSAIEAVVDAVKELPKKLVQGLKDAAERVKEEFSNMIKNAKESGEHFVEGLVDGIKDKAEKVIKAVKEIAESVKEFLGFSRPDKGPLHEYEEWMPHFMQGLAKGINQNKGLVTKAINSLAKDMTLPLDANANMNLAMAGDGSFSMPYGNNTTNVYVDHINDLQDLIRIQNRAQQRNRMGAR